MALTLQEIKDLRVRGKYRETVEAVEAWPRENSESSAQERMAVLLEGAWARYQLGEYSLAEKDARIVASFFPGTDAFQSAQLLMAHCAERQGRLDEAGKRLQNIPFGRVRDNLYLTILNAKKRAGQEITAIVALQLAAEAMMRAPYEIVDGHIINNVAWLLHQARDQADVRELAQILPGLVEMAIGIYQQTNAAQNHQANILFRAASIFLATPGWERPALGVDEQSIASWEQLNVSQPSERFQQNLQGARELREKIIARIKELGL